MIKHEQNKKTPDIYSLPLKCDLRSSFSMKEAQRTLPDAYHRRSWCQPVLGGRHSFILRREKRTVSNLPGL